MRRELLTNSETGIIVRAPRGARGPREASLRLLREGEMMRREASWLLEVRYTLVCICLPGTLVGIPPLVYASWYTLGREPPAHPGCTRYVTALCYRTACVTE